MVEENDRLSSQGEDLSLDTEVARIAALVSEALRSGNQQRREELGARLELAQERLAERGAPEGLIPFLEMMRGLLSAGDVSAHLQDLPQTYRALYEQIMDDVGTREQEEQLTVRQVMDQVSQNAVLAIKHGTFDQRRQMADTVLMMEEASRKRPDLAALSGFLVAIRVLLKGGDPSSFEERLTGPFRERWDEIRRILDE
jgi:hypothetical protein